MEFIKSRRSVRTFKDKKIEDDLKEKIEVFLEDLEKEYSSKYRFPLMDLKLEGKIGTYGVIRGTNSYVGGVMLKDGNLVELGYLFEKIIIYLTSLKLGTCWLGGTFKREEFIHAMDLKGGETLIVVTPIGHIDEKMSFKEKSMRAIAQSDKRKDFDDLFFYEGLEPLYLSDLGVFKDALEMVRIGPSASNKQPWRIIKEDHNYNFYLERTKGYGKNLSYDIQMLDMGIAMYHFQYTLEKKNVHGKFITLKKPRPYDNFEYISTWVLED